MSEMEFWKWEDANIQSVVWPPITQDQDGLRPCVRIGRLRRSTAFVVYLFRGPVLLWCESCPHPVEIERGGSTLEGWLMAFLKKREAVERKRSDLAAERAGEWAKAHPALWEYLVSEEYPDGAPRERSMLCVFVENGLFKAALQDRDQQQSLWAAGEALESVLEALEAKCVSGDPSEWRAMGGVTKKGKRR